MPTFSLPLSDGSLVDGQLFEPEHSSLPALLERKPLLVTVPGGSYTADFFNADERHSIHTVCNQLGLRVVAVNRPGYGATPGLTTVDKFQDSFIRQSGRWLHRLALPAIWREVAVPSGANSIVLYGHSIGAAVCVVAAAEYEKHKDEARFRLSGLGLSGVGCRPTVNDFDALFKTEHQAQARTAVEPLTFPPEEQNLYMLGSARELYDERILAQTGRLRNNIYLQELYDIEYLWPNYWKTYAELVAVAVLYNPGQEDKLWVVNDITVQEMKEGFSRAPCVYAAASPLAPHAIEFSYQSTGFYIKLLGFAVECAAQLEIASAIERGKEKSNGQVDS